MQIAFHIGANCTDEDRLLKSILRNAQTLLQHGIDVPGPGKYRALLRETIQNLDGKRPTDDTREILLDTIVEHDGIQRIVLTNDNFIAVPKRIFDHDSFYPQIEGKLRTFCQIFPDDDLTFFLSLRNPVTFLQDVAKRAEVATLRDYLGTLQPLQIRWSDVIGRIRRAAPHARVVTWCNEDTPLIWEDLIRLQSGMPADVPVIGAHDVLSRLISAGGQQALRQMTMPSDRIARHDAIADILETHGLPAALEETIDLPELSDDLIAAMSHGYDDDLDVIGAMDGVDLITPFV